MNNHLIWCVSHSDVNMGTVLDWFATERDADQHIRILKDADPSIDPLKISRYIPTSRKGLVRWLNANFETDNG